MNDSAIVYAFLATLSGCAISIAAGVIAVLKHHSVGVVPLDASAPSISGATTQTRKPEHSVVPYALQGAAAVKATKSGKFERTLTNKRFVIDINAVVSQPKKPVGRIFYRIPAHRHSEVYERAAEACGCR